MELHEQEKKRGKENHAGMVPAARHSRISDATEHGNKLAGAYLWELILINYEKAWPRGLKHGSVREKHLKGYLRRFGNRSAVASAILNVSEISYRRDWPKGRERLRLDRHKQPSTLAIGSHGLHGSWRHPQPTEVDRKAETHNPRPLHAICAAQ